MFDNAWLASRFSGTEPLLRIYAEAESPEQLTALLDAAAPRRQIEEAGLTVVFLATVATWLADETEDQAGTRRRLRRLLERTDRVLARLWSGSARGRVNGMPATPPPGSRPV